MRPRQISDHLTYADVQKIIEDWSHKNGYSLLTSNSVLNIHRDELIAFAYEQGRRDGKEEGQ